MPAAAITPAPLLLVDGFNVLWAGTFGFPAEIRSRDKTRELTGLFAFFALLRATIRDDLDVNPPEVVVVFDGEHGSAARVAADQDYKANREATPEALKPLQFLASVKAGLDLHGIRWVELPDQEADDVIATLATDAAPTRPVRIMSRDADYYQLLTDQIRIINRSRKATARLITATEVLERYGVTPEQWPAFRALTGDASDNIPGVRGVGPKVAAQLLSDQLPLEKLPNSDRLTGAKGRAITEAWRDVKRWRDMITMKRDLDVPLTPTGEVSPQLPKPAEVVEKLGLW
ncbi:DNA polymerase-1 [Kitasatospora sp. GP30]|uniref:5'-3' exonuclease n=1 Tax=Kitasatospora sp. GP30 TaxID=3035084 RepID=UPI000CA8AD87|nr:5'-3' exonuclease H3TH domain-containing protein [Kitasatospora sp. GP30]MDH6144136.1 DNA polymerase-1 [Kitasatospora sp. GP30]